MRTLFLSFAVFFWGGLVRASDFDRTVAPLLIERCYDCHSGAKPRGGLDLTTRAGVTAGGKSGPVLMPGRSADSLLWTLIDQEKMPPKKPLSREEKALVRSWIESGARWGTDPIDPFRLTTSRRAGIDWWSLRPLDAGAIPEPSPSVEGGNPIDRFVAVRRRAAGLAASPPADARTRLRRLTFDLTGLPPTPEEVEAFVADTAPDAMERAVDRLLASPQYGIRWARHWLDLARFGESNGFEFDEFRANAWRYRDWVVAALNADMPYRDFARWQLAGDILHPEDPEAIIATGFLVAGAYDTVGQTQQSLAMRHVVRQDELEDIAGTIGQTFLGLTVNCARCHDHKFDPIRQEEYFRFTASLSGVRHGERVLPQSEATRRATQARLAELVQAIEEIETPARKAILAARQGTPMPPPQPLARWDFTRGLQDQIRGKPVRLHGGAHLLPGGLKVGGKGYAQSAPLPKSLRARTLEAWVTLDRLDQAGGAVLSLQTPDGNAFDAIVYGERESQRWMAGSNGFVRTQPFGGPAETEAARRPVHLALVYSEEGTIRAYRNGRPYGRPYTTGLHTYSAGTAEVLFGLRHSPPGGNRHLEGTVHRAALHDRALTAAEVAACADARDFVSEEDLVEHLSPEKRQRRTLLLALRAQVEAILTGAQPKVYAVNPRPAEPTRLLLRGNPQTPGAQVSPGGFAALAGVPANFGLGPTALEAEGRLRLADWISHPKNALFARVLVNRLWQHHFGTGLVETPNDFGFNGGRPSHPELLDWLAQELLRSGGSLKHMHRLMVTSATYQQASMPRADGLARDAGNRLLWRKSPTRLEAEAVRDAMLATTGRLNRRMGGPGYQEFQNVRAPGTAANLYQPIDPVGEEFDRRTLYRTWGRGARSPLLDTFDCPDPSTTAPRRASTTTPLQALALLNNAQVLRNATRFAQRLEHEYPGNVDQQIERAFALAYGRVPNAAEKEQTRAVVARYGLAVLPRVLFNSNEFLHID